MSALRPVPSTPTAALDVEPLGPAFGSRGWEDLDGDRIVDCDLRDQAAVNYWFRANRPEYVYLVDGTVGGIMANSTRPAEFIYDNMMIHATVVQAAHHFGVKKLLYLGSSCIYPRLCPQPMKEEHLLSGPLERLVHL